MSETTSDRRDFLRSCGCALAGIAIVGIAPIVSGCEFSTVTTASDDGGGGGTTVDIDVSMLTEDGTGLLSEQRGPDRKKIFVARLDGAYRALSTECPHSQFPVAPLGTRLVCTGGQGHGSSFDYEGKCLEGPALPFGPLRTYPSTYDAARKVLRVTVG